MCCGPSNSRVGADHARMKLTGEHCVPITKRLTLDNVDLDDQSEMDALDDQMFEAGMKRVRAEGEELGRRGLMDENGKMLIKDLPADMKEGSERDFGG